MISSEARGPLNQPSHYRIPEDVLLQVFEELSGRHIGGWEPAPWILIAVCRRWREFAITSPTLWTQLTFSPKSQLRELQHDYWRSQKERLEAQLARAGNCTLELRIDVTHVPQVDPPGILEDVFRLLVANVGRCTTLSLGGKAPSVWSLAHSSEEESTSLPTLQSLSILNSSWTTEPDTSLVHILPPDRLWTYFSATRPL
ncbi:hypothetical protein BDV98DRAFT_366856 [Pterulicium gracile]|uniref:F-box domain-containing protein n=1 Tax=Pterulicium gracile TaxID=1884261 RepID=A0A5C3QQK9_9AGAR|nr:hypothetical protein BDV98DRAFT_366856 [Pterula gracilis]